MRLSKANFAGLTSSLQHDEMKSILAGTWPPLRPLPVFKYETAEYRATIDFDKKRGEWVCRKTSLPSNEVQELRGGLREITLALPHGDAETFTEGAEQQEQELEMDTNRRLQALQEWREKYKNGALYFELRDHLSERQRTEMDDSLRLSLTARQLQFNAKNLTNVFDDLSVAGGRFAALMEFAKQNKTKQGTDPQALGEQTVPEVEPTINRDEQSQGINSCEAGSVPDNEFARDQEPAEPCNEADEFPAVSIKNVFPEPEQAPLAEQMVPHIASQQFEIETSEFADADSASLVEHPQQEGQRSAAFTSFAAQLQRGLSSADYEGLSSRFPSFEISTFRVAVFALLLLFAVASFNVGLRVGRGGPLGRRLREASKSIVAVDAKPPALPDPAAESASQTPPPSVTSSNDSAGTDKPRDAAPSEASEEKSKDNKGSSEDSAEVRSTDSDSSPAKESDPSAKPEVNSEHNAAIGPIVRNVLPPASSKFAHSHRAASPITSAPRSPGPYRLTSTIGAAPHLPRSSAILVSPPARGSPPLRVSFPEKTIAATSSLAMTSQLSVLVAPETGPTAAHKSARLEGGELFSFVWPRYPRPGNRYGLAETIRVRATIGQTGQVLEVKLLSGAISLLPATTRAIRQWRYRPILLDKRSVQAQQDVTIEFRPPQYSSRVSTQFPSRN